MNQLLFLLLLIAQVQAGPGLATDYYDRRKTLVPPDLHQTIFEMNQASLSDLRFEGEKLRKVKYYLLNGEIRLAQVYLMSLAHSESKLRPIVNRYLGILWFLDGEFAKSYEALKLRELGNSPHFAKICTLLILNKIVLNKIDGLENDWARCESENYGHVREQNVIWLETLVQMKLKPKGSTRAPFRNYRLAALDREQLKILLKLGLYLNQDKLILEQIPELTVDQLQDTEVREIVGHIFFRQGSYAKAFRFIEDLKSPNAENIKGNLYVLRNKYELAYAQFKLAVEQKQNSQNAIERILPLAWILGDWQNGALYAERVLASPQTQVNKVALMAVFHLQSGNFTRADDLLDVVAYRTRQGAHLEIAQMRSFIALMQNRPDKLRKEAMSSCQQYDLVNCWLLQQLSQWDSFPLTVRRTEEIPEGREWETLTKEELNRPLTETAYVNQLDIEELDDKLIKLIPSP